MEVYCSLCNTGHLSGLTGNICVVCASSATSASPTSLALSGSLLSLIVEEAAYANGYMEGYLRGQRVVKQERAISDYEEEKITDNVSIGITRYLCYRWRIRDFGAETGNIKDNAADDDIVGCFIIRRDKVPQPSLRNVQHLQTLQRMCKDCSTPVLLVLNLPLESSSSSSSSWILSITYRAYFLSADSKNLIPLPVHVITANGGDNYNSSSNNFSGRTINTNESLFNFDSFSLYCKGTFSDEQQRTLERKTTMDIISATDTFIHTIQKLDQIKSDMIQAIDLENEVSALRRKVEENMKAKAVERTTKTTT